MPLCRLVPNDKVAPDRPFTDRVVPDIFWLVRTNLTSYNEGIGFQDWC